MSTVLSNGVIVPDVGSTNWAADLETNWTLLNALIGAVGANVRLDRPNIWTAAQTFSAGIYGDLDGTAAMAVNDANGNAIATTYALKTDVTSLQTAVSGKAADSEVVHLAGTETITGDKTFAGAVVTHNVRPETDNTYSLGSAGSIWNTVYANAYYANSSFGVRYANTAASGQPAISGYIQRAFGVISSDGKYFSRFKSQIAAAYSRTEFETYLYDSNSAASVKIQHVAQYNSSTGTISLYIRPTVSGVVDLGIASNKWKTLNGINPGALSFPANSYVDIDTTGWTAGGVNRVQINGADPTYPGWLFVRLSNIDPATDYCLIRLFGTGNGDMSVYAGHSDKHMMVIAPVPPNTAVRVYCSVLPAYCRYYVCQGNV